MYPSPGSVPIFLLPSKRGFICKPTNESNPNGWGDPSVDEEGRPIGPPPTPGGPNPFVFFSKEPSSEPPSEPSSEPSSSLRTLYPPTSDSRSPYSSFTFSSSPSNSKFTQAGGEISWWGRYLVSRDGSNPPSLLSRVRRVISFHGPSSRYFPSLSFSYNSSVQNNYIFSNGGVAAVAPGPVVGAAVMEYTQEFSEPPSSPPIYFNQKKILLLIAVVASSEPSQNGGGEGGVELYVSYWNGFSTPLEEVDRLSSEERDYSLPGQASFYGWQFIISHPADISGDGGELGGNNCEYGPESPWFFNSKGREATHMRRKNVWYEGGWSEVYTKEEEDWQNQDAFVWYILKITFPESGPPLLLSSPFPISAEFSIHENYSSSYPPYFWTYMYRLIGQLNTDPDYTCIGDGTEIYAYNETASRVIGDVTVLADYVDKNRHSGSLSLDIEDELVAGRISLDHWEVGIQPSPCCYYENIFYALEEASCVAPLLDGPVIGFGYAGAMVMYLEPASEFSDNLPVSGLNAKHEYFLLYDKAWLRFQADMDRAQLIKNTFFSPDLIVHYLEEDYVDEELDYVTYDSSYRVRYPLYMDIRTNFYVFKELFWEGLGDPYTVTYDVSLCVHIDEPPTSDGDEVEYPPSSYFKVLSTKRMEDNKFPEPNTYPLIAFGYIFSYMGFDFNTGLIDYSGDFEYWPSHQMNYFQGYAYDGLWLRDNDEGQYYCPTFNQFSRDPSTEPKVNPSRFPDYYTKLFSFLEEPPSINEWMGLTPSEKFMVPEGSYQCNSECDFVISCMIADPDDPSVRDHRETIPFSYFGQGLNKVYYQSLDGIVSYNENKVKYWPIYQV